MAMITGVRNGELVQIDESELEPFCIEHETENERIVNKGWRFKDGTIFQNDIHMFLKKIPEAVEAQAGNLN